GVTAGIFGTMGFDQLFDLLKQAFPEVSGSTPSPGLYLLPDGTVLDSRDPNNMKIISSDGQSVISSNGQIVTPAGTIQVTPVAPNSNGGTTGSITITPNSGPSA